MKKVKKINYSQYKVRKFTPTLYSESYAAFGCGANLLATILNRHPFSFRSPDKINPDNWPDYYIVGQLKKNGWKVIKLNTLEVSNVDYIEDNITKNHIVIMSQHYNKRDASWAICHNNLYIHNFAITRLDNYEFLNRPIITSFLIWNPLLA